MFVFLPKKWAKNGTKIPKMTPRKNFAFEEAMGGQIPTDIWTLHKKKRPKFFGRLRRPRYFLTSTRFLKVNFLRQGTLKILPHSKIRQILPSVDETYCRTTENGANPTACTQQNCHSCTAIAGSRDATRAELNSEGTMSLQVMQSVGGFRKIWRAALARRLRYKDFWRCVARTPPPLEALHLVVKCWGV